MTEDELQQAIRLNSIFMPYSFGQRRKAYERQGISFPSGDGIRFAHYTSAEAALSILRSKRIWMRSTTCMSDFSEVQHGFDIFLKYFDQERTNEFIRVLDKCLPGVAKRTIDLFNSWWQAPPQHNLLFNTYVTSVSEHDPETEDRHGRLSMWRAFGATSSTSVAIVIKPSTASSGAEALNLVFSPVAYLTEGEAHDQIRLVVSNIERESEFLKSLSRDAVMRTLFLMLFAGVACFKHEGFREEHEWRAVYHPNVFSSPLMERSLVNYDGLPQCVYKIPLDKTVAPELADLDIANIVERIIIGPSAYPWVLYQAFVELLQTAGVADAEKRVWVSGIPLRH